MAYTFTKIQIEEAIKKSTSLRQVILSLDLKPKGGGNYRTIKAYIKDNNLDISHFTGKSQKIKQKATPGRPIDDYLSNKFSISSHSLKNKLIKLNLLEHKCYDCQLREWNNKPIPIELHHIDGDHDNNNLSNLMILCPNCHSQTDNYCSKSKKDKEIKPKKVRIKKESKKCLDCNIDIYRKSLRCKKCGDLNRKNKAIKTKINWISTNELITLAKEIGFVQLGKKLGISDNAIRKRIKKYPNYIAP